LDIKNALKIASKSLWRYVPLPGTIKIRLRNLPRFCKTYWLILGHSKNNALAAKSLLERRVNTTVLAFTPYSEKSDKQNKHIDILAIRYDNQVCVADIIANISLSNHPLSTLSLSLIDCSSAAGQSNKSLGKTDCFAAFNVIECTLDNLAETRNQVLNKMSSEWVLILNTDYLLHEKTLCTLIADADKSLEEIACWEARELPHEQHKTYDPISAEMNVCDFNCALVKNSALQQIAGFDQRFVAYNEAIELSYRLREAGFHLKYVPRAVVHRGNTQHINNAYVCEVIGNFLLRTRYGLLSDRLCIWPLLFFALLRPNAASARTLLVRRFFTYYLPMNTSLLSERTEQQSAYFSFYFFGYEKQRYNELSQDTLPEDGPLVSIITRTVKGHDELLTQAGHSVFNQTYSNIEWVVVEDGGTTQTSVVDKFRRTQRVSYYPLKKVGRAEAGNQGMAMANGQWLMFLDDDDCLYADHVETLVRARLEQRQASAAYSLAWEVESEIRAGGKEIIEGQYHQVSSNIQAFNCELLRNFNYIPIQSLLFDASLFKERGGFDARFDCLEDWHLWQRYSHQKHFIYVPKITSMYRVPKNIEQRLARQTLFVNAYQTVKKDAARVIDALASETPNTRS
jgi:GT2 family glycosyltransferase